MSYLYTQANRLDEPHNYMYTPFQGEVLLHSYQGSRLDALQRFAEVVSESEACDAAYEIYALPFLERALDSVSIDAGNRFRMLVPDGNATRSGSDEAEDRCLNGLAMLLPQFAPGASIATLDLAHALIAAQLRGQHHDLAKEWLDRLVQRFEVTKKIYETYPSGFRKGEGTGRSVRLYWLFALALCLYYASTRQLKYLSTLLKVCDLLCSLPENMCSGYVSSRTMSAIMATEWISVQRLAEEKGIHVAFK